MRFEESTPTTRTPARAIGTAIRRADAELDDRPAVLARLGDVEVHVLRDAPVPRVVGSAIAS